MGRRTMLVASVILAWALPALGQTVGSDPIEIPLKMVDGRLAVTVEGPDRGSYDFVLALGMTYLTRSAAARIGNGLSSLTLGGVPVDTEEVVSVPDTYFGDGHRFAGVIGGATLNGFDILIDVPNGRLVLKPIGRTVRWDGVSLTSPVNVEVFHDVLIRTQVQIGDDVYSGLLDLEAPTLQVNQPVQAAAGFSGGTIDSFRMGYSGWEELQIAVTDSPVFGRWVPVGTGFVIIGAEVARDCAIAISWFHSELRTCRR